MVESLLAIEGAACVSLGTATPCSEIARAAAAHRVDIVALSFSATFAEKAAVAGLSELRTLLPSDVLIWAGGACIERLRRPVPGVDLVGNLEGLIERVQGLARAAREPLTKDKHRLDQMPEKSICPARAESSRHSSTAASQAPRLESLNAVGAAQPLPQGAGGAFPSSSRLIRRTLPGSNMP